jgi:hypothetical protein
MVPYEGERSMTDSRASRISAATRLGVGVSFVMIALLSFASSRLVEHTQRHAYVRGATPQPIYRLIGGEIYQLSAKAGVAGLTKQGVLGSGITPTCFWSADGGADNPITILSTKDDERDLHVFATFQVPSSGEFHISCQGIAEVFVDDAEDAGHDFSAVLVVFATLFGVLGVGLALSGAYGVGEERREDSAAAEMAE